MKLTLICPKWQQGLWSVRIFKMPPLGLARIASVTPDDIEVEIIDENIEEIHFEETDIVGISVMTPTAHRAYEIADKYRKLGSKVILGGIHPSILPEEAIEHADSVVIGEADDIWPQVIQDCVKNKLQKFYIAEQEPDLSKLPPLRRDLLKKISTSSEILFRLLEDVHLIVIFVLFPDSMERKCGIGQ